MASDQEILEAIDAAFCRVSKPFQFLDPTHCEECAEYNAILCERDRETLRIEDVGNPGWDPICGSSPHGIAYYMPALARLALSPATYEWGWYGDQLMFHLYSGARYNSFFTYCSPDQRSAVAGLISHFICTRTSDPLRTTADEELIRAHEIWSEV